MVTGVGSNVFGANEVERIVKRNADWFMRFIVAGVQGVLRDGRPLYTEKIPEADRLAALLMAPRPLWVALEEKDPETAAALWLQFFVQERRVRFHLLAPELTK